MLGAGAGWERSWVWEGMVGVPAEVVEAPYVE